MSVENEDHLFVEVALAVQLFSGRDLADVSIIGDESVVSTGPMKKVLSQAA